MSSPTTTPHQTSTSTRSNPPPPPSLKLYIVTTLTSPLPPHHPLTQTHGTRLAGAFLTRAEAIHKAYDFLQQQNFIDTQPFFTELGQEGYKVRSSVVGTRAWIEEVECVMRIPELEDRMWSGADVAGEGVEEAMVSEMVGEGGRSVL